MVEIFTKVNSEVDSMTLAAQTSLRVGDILVDPVRHFMLKNLWTSVHAVVPNITDSWILAIVETDPSEAQITTAMQTTEQNPESSNAYSDGQREARLVWAVATVDLVGIVAGGSLQQSIQWKLPPKGIPILRNRGVRVVIFNTDAADAFVNGPAIKLFHRMMGGWF